MKIEFLDPKMLKYGSYLAKLHSTRVVIISMRFLRFGNYKNTKMARTKVGKKAIVEKKFAKRKPKYGPRPAVFRPGTRILLQIRRLQQSNKLLVAKYAFERCVRDILRKIVDSKAPMSLGKKALEALP